MTANLVLTETSDADAPTMNEGAASVLECVCASVWLCMGACVCVCVQWCR